MPWRHKRKAYYLGLVIATTLAFTLVYNYGMATLEGRPQTITQSLEVVFQTFTTTGYGEDAPWETSQMHLLVIGMQLAGIGLILTGVDVFAVPWLRGALSTSPPTEAVDLSDHVVLCTFTPRGEAFISELEARDAGYVVVEPDSETATDLYESGYSVICGDPESTDVLENAAIDSAKTVVADGDDDTNASIVLAAREANPDVRVVSFVEDRELENYLRIAGADDVFSPRQLLGERLARQVPTAVTTTVEEGIEIGDDFELVELPVQPGSELDGVRFEESDIHTRTSANVIGAWVANDFECPVEPTTMLDEDTTLLIAGNPRQLERLRDLTASEVRPMSPRNVVIAGKGQAGAAAEAKLAGPGTNVTVLDIQEIEGVDIVGDARDPKQLETAGITEASTLVLTVSEDTIAVFVTLIARDLNPDVQIVVRANEEENIQKLYRAGADYVQSLARVSGRMLVSTVFEDEEVLAYDRQVNVVRLPAEKLAGRTLSEADVRAETGCTVVAVERGDETIVDLDPDTFQFREEDEVIVVGTDESVSEFERRFGS